MVTVERKILVLVDFPDGCRLEMNPSDGNPEGWTINFPAGFVLRCRHGLEMTTEPFVGSFQEE